MEKEIADLNTQLININETNAAELETLKATIAELENQLKSAQDAGAAGAAQKEEQENIINGLKNELGKKIKYTKANEERASRNGCSCNLYYFSLNQTCFIVIFLFFFILKHPNKSFF